MTRLLILVSVFVVCSGGARALADGRVVVLPFFGPHAETIRREVVRVLRSHRQLSVVETGDADRSARKLGVDANSREGRLAVAADLGISAWIEAIVQRRGGDLRATVLVYDGKDHERIARAVTTRRSANQIVVQIRKALWKDTREALLSARPPEASDGAQASVATVPASVHPTPPIEDTSVVAAGRWHVRPTGTVTPPPAASPTPPADASRRARAFDVRLGIGTLTRVLTYSEPVTLGLGDYQLPVAPQAELEARYYPARHTTEHWPAYFGLDVRAGLALTRASETASGEKFETRIDAFGLGLRTRYPFRRHEASVLVGYGVQRFRFEDSNARPAPTPDVDYRMWRVSAEGDFSFGDRFRVGGSAGLLVLAGVGEFGARDWFPNLSGAGVELAAFGALPLGKNVALQAKLGMQRFFFDFNSTPKDPSVAGGATDDFVTATLSVRFAL